MCLNSLFEVGAFKLPISPKERERERERERENGERERVNGERENGERERERMERERKRAVQITHVYILRVSSFQL